MPERDPTRASPAPQERDVADAALTYRVELWKRDNRALERVLGRAASAAMAQAVYSAACKEYPDRRVRLCRGDEIVEECGGE